MTASRRLALVVLGGTAVPSTAGIRYDAIVARSARAGARMLEHRSGRLHRLELDIRLDRQRSRLISALEVPRSGDPPGGSGARPRAPHRLALTEKIALTQAGQPLERDAAASSSGRREGQRRARRGWNLDHRSTHASWATARRGHRLGGDRATASETAGQLGHKNPTITTGI